MGGARSFAPRGTILLDARALVGAVRGEGGGRRLEPRVGMYVAGWAGRVWRFFLAAERIGIVRASSALLLGVSGRESFRLLHGLELELEMGEKRPREKEEENLRSLRRPGVARWAGVLGMGVEVEGEEARNSRRVWESGIGWERSRFGGAAALRMPATADLRRRILVSFEETGERSSTEVGGVEGVEVLELWSEDVRGVELMVTLRWWRVACDMSSF